MLSFRLFLEQADIKEQEHDGAVVHKFNVGKHKVEVTHYMDKGRKGTFVDTDFEVNGKTMRDPSNKFSQSEAFRILSGVGQSIARIKEKHKEPDKKLQVSMYGNTEQKEKVYQMASKRLARQLGGKHRYSKKEMTSYLTFKE